MLAYAGKARGVYWSTSPLPAVTRYSSTVSLWFLACSNNISLLDFFGGILKNLGSLKLSFEEWVFCAPTDGVDLNIWLDSRINPCGISYELHLWTLKHSILQPLYQPIPVISYGSIKISCLVLLCFLHTMVIPLRGTFSREKANAVWGTPWSRSLGNVTAADFVASSKKRGRKVHFKRSILRSLAQKWELEVWRQDVSAWQCRDLSPRMG